jgi:serralysin
MAGNSYALESSETSFNQDLNGDGVTGLTTTVIQTDTNAFGSVSLTQIADRYYLYSSSGSGPALQQNGAYVVVGQLGSGWTAIGAALTTSGYEIAWKETGADAYKVWTTDSSGNYLFDSGAALSGTSYQVESLERSFNQDLNGDGVIGPLPTAASLSGNELDFASGIANNQLWFQQSGNNLQIDVMGTNSQVTVASWFASTGAQVSEITAGGLKLDSQVSQLVQAMATYAAANPGFDPTSPLNASAPNNPALQTAIAADWHH